MLESNPLAAVPSVTGTTSANQDRDVVDEGGRARLSRRLLNGVAGVPARRHSARVVSYGVVSP